MTTTGTGQETVPMYQRTWLIGHPEAYDAGVKGGYGGPGQGCCASCENGPPCPDYEPKPCCFGCSKGLLCDGGTSSIDRHNYTKGCRGVGEYKVHPTGVHDHPRCPQPENCYWPMFRNTNHRRAGMPTVHGHADLYEDLCGDTSKAHVNPEGNILSQKMYRRKYNFEKEPYFFAKEYDDPFCKDHPSPWTEEGYYQYKDQHEATKSKVRGHAPRSQ